MHSQPTAQLVKAILSLWHETQLAGRMNYTFTNLNTSVGISTVKELCQMPRVQQG